MLYSTCQYVSELVSCQAQSIAMLLVKVAVMVTHDEIMSWG